MGMQMSKNTAGSHTTVTQASGGSHINYTNINYYSHSASASQNKQDITQDPSKFTQPMVDIMKESAVPLKSPSAEACGYSDRVAQLTLGNSTITTQEAANITVAYGEWPSYLSDLDATAVDKTTKPGVSCDRFYTLPGKKWEATTKGWEWKLPDALTELGVFGQNCQFHFLYRCGWSIHVQCNATKFHQGTLLVVAVPDHQLGTTYQPEFDNVMPGKAGREVKYPYNFEDGTSLANSLIYPHQWINLRTNNSATLVLPYANAIPMDSPIRHSSWSLLVIPVVPLACATGTTPFVGITITLAPMFSEFSGLRRAIAQGIPTTNTPGSYQFLTTDEDSSACILPDFTPTQEIHIPGEVKNLQALCQVESLLEINNVDGKTGIERLRLEVSTQSELDRQLFALKVSFTEGEIMSKTLCGVMCSYYTQWSGSLEITFMFTGSFMTTGKLLLAYTPPGGSAPASREDAMLGTHVIWDFGLQSSITLVVPWICGGYYRDVNRANNYYAAGYVTGWFQTNMVIPPDFPSTAYILCFLAAQPNFSLRILKDRPDITQTAALQAPVETALNSAISSVIAGITAQDTQPSSHNISTSETPALQAAETGASSNASDEGMMETRHVVNTNTVSETSIESFYGRCGLVSIKEIADNKQVEKWLVNFNEFVQLRAKIELFTYMRFDIEFTLVATFTKGNSASQHPVQVQVMYLPPEQLLQLQQDSYAWQSAANPSAIFSANTVPARFSVPFVGTANAYTIMYDGYNVFGSNRPSADYGMINSSHMGSMAFRAISQLQATEKVKFMDLCQVKDVRAWCPRAPRMAPYKYIRNPVFETQDRIVPNRNNITTTGAFGQQSGAIYVGNYKIMNRHLATHEDWENVEWEDYNRDILVARTTAHGADKLARCHCNTGVYYCKSRNKHYPVTSRVQASIGSRLVSTTQLDTRPICSLPSGISEPGDCGGILRCQHGVIGIVTAGGQGVVGFADVRDLFWVEHEAMEQGLTDYIQQLGNSFGQGFTAEITNYASQLSEMLIGADGMVERCLQTFVKVISAVVIATRSQGDVPTILATLALIGCDGSPWRWLKRQFCGIFKIPYVEKQGDDWLKKFTSYVNAFKGLDWVAEKIMKFIDWMKNKLIPQARERQEFTTNLKTLPLLEAQVATLEHSCPTTEQQETIFGNIQYLAHHCRRYAPLYAAEARRVYALEKRILGYIQFKSKQRIEPVCLLIHGTAGTGKSLATSIIGRKLAEYEHSEVYAIPPDSDHFDGYQQQAVVVMDDLNQNPDGKDMVAFCQMVSTVPYHVPMAAIEEKGMLFTSSYVLASTNSGSIHPPTVSNSKALSRRFAFDVDIEVSEHYKTHNGTLDVVNATQRCEDCCPANFKTCMPLICGEAYQLVDRRNGMRYSIDTMISAMRAEWKRRNQVGLCYVRLFQGPPQFKPLKISVDPEIPAPPAIADLLASVDSEEVREYCKKKGWIVEVPVTATTLERNVSIATTILSSLVLLTSVITLVYLVYRLFAGYQGPYTGLPNAKPKPPVLREVRAQGPLMDFGVGMMKKNIVTVRTGAGEFTGLGVHDHVLVLPKHSHPAEIVVVDGKETPVEDAYNLTDEQGVSLELTLVTLKRNEKFRDIRAMIPENPCGTNEAVVCVNTSNFPNAFLPVGKVEYYGYLNLAGSPTHRTMMYNFPTKAGQCGGVVLSTGKVLGIHIGGNGAQGFCAALKRSYFTKPQGKIDWVEPSKKHGFPVINAPSKTKLEPSVFFDVFEGVKEPAALHPKDPRLEVNLEEALFSKYTGNVDIEMPEEMKEAVDHYANQLLALDIPTEPLSMEEAIYGTEGLEALDLTTSAGYPYVTMGIKKRDILNKETRDVKKMQECIDKYGLNLPMVTYIKDELRSKEKVKKGKSRLIEASSLNDSVAMRCYFGNLYKAFHQNPGTLTGCAVGCDPDTFWSKIPVMMDGELFGFDYTAYDASLSPLMFQALQMVLEKIGFGEGKHFIDNLCYSHHLFRDKYYFVKGGMPSGCSGTSIFNSMINNIIIRTVVLQTYKGIELDQLKIIAYGDDVIASYPYRIDPAELAKAGAKLGLHMTPPDKSETYVDLDWTNVTFLKRNFVPDEKYPFLVHPVMPMKEIYESIRWTRDARNTQDHVRSLCLLAWHNGRKEYEEFCRKIRSVPVGRALHLPSYSSLLREWYEKF
uniref:Genome polyprotein n=2 Tax=Porcine enterovirus 9 (strain UKG/410/73) TaxID=64141 RepID=POLG_PEV9U|nr:RecName: Full=Genome polyprotein; Contains: RecName: Full=P1; Contains: RecName: Full=Capsid protein VP0; AltName: Full=VP4-VP2; Contains: RecName: Full=Capsid protein VP4; AltName: Full=P1A; AltName: Full=Virion protein 4; Contains: RecName: Full=Capsid protein VP2; AltName: Full=P1B; AltName: Full=Virion protein 2; Contains: RecName: Full=Capsid protein VP3; AltName: Full=P1C; AltName: Full=Virion protein 3; Contains: RecName: Full=Capsid protein VP1; AltName: Full=P1D; AltName: Full=Virion pr